MKWAFVLFCFCLQTRVCNVIALMLSSVSFVLFIGQVKEITRHLKVENGELSYVVEMSTNVMSLQEHLRASLAKI